MRTRISIALVSCIAVAAVVLAGEVAGVKMADTVSVEGKTLKLNGMGLRKKVVFKVYVAGLYLETPSPAGEAIMIAGFAALVSYMCFRHARFAEEEDAGH